MKPLSSNKKIVITLASMVLARMSYPILKNLYFLYFKPDYWNYLKFSKRVKKEIERRSKTQNSSIVFFELEETREMVQSSDESEPNRVSLYLLKHLEQKINAGKRTNDPFLPPFDNGVFIMNLSKTHSLIFNKYMVTRNHLLVITKIFEAQTDTLTENDLFETYNVMKLHSAFAFFNSDEKSGASQKHKHLQILPLANFQTTYISKILEVVNEIDKDALEIDSSAQVSFLFFPFFEKYKYCLAKFREYNPFLESPDEYKKYLYAVYTKCRKRLNIENKNNSFNLIFGKNWMFLVLRKKEKFNNVVSLNCLACLGSILTSNVEKFENLKNLKPNDVFDEILVAREDEGDYSIIIE